MAAMDPGLRRGDQMEMLRISNPPYQEFVSYVAYVAVRSYGGLSSLPRKRL